MLMLGVLQFKQVYSEALLWIYPYSCCEIDADSVRREGIRPIIAHNKNNKVNWIYDSFDDDLPE